MNDKMVSVSGDVVKMARNNGFWRRQGPSRNGDGAPTWGAGQI